MYKTKDKRVATAQPCVARKQLVGMLPKTMKKVLRVLLVL